MSEESRDNFPFGEDQLFYAALWWTASLPGGAEVVADICHDHGKVTEIFYPGPGINPKASPVTAGQVRTFFETLYSSLKQGACEVEHDHWGNGRVFLNLAKTYSYGMEDFDCYSPVLANACTAAGILANDSLCNKNTLFLHDDGRILTRQRSGTGWEISAIDYPGMPVLPYPAVDLKREDFEGMPRIRIERQYRVVPLHPGDTLKWVYNSVAGLRCESEMKVTRDNQAVYVFTAGAAKPLADLTDEEIINGGPDIIHNSPDTPLYSLTPGYTDEYGTSIEATDDPRIVRELTAPMPVMEVTVPFQFGIGSSFAVAQPGDRIVWESSSPRVYRKEDLEREVIRMVPAPSAPAGSAPAP